MTVRMPALLTSLVLSVALSSGLQPTPAAGGDGSSAAGETPFRRLDEMHVGDGEVHRLTASQSSPNGTGGQTYRFYYNEKFPGDQMVVKPGESMRIRLVNALQGLDQDILKDLRPRVVGGRHDPDAHAELIAHSSRLTNLHTHGLHVAPGERSDNVMLEVPPDRENLYQIDVPIFREDGDYIRRKIRFNIDGDGQDTLFVINERNYNKRPGQAMSGEQLGGGHDHMPGHMDFLGSAECDGGRGPDGQEPWPLRLGTEEEWTITNGSEVNHPFHIHVSPFWVVDIEEWKAVELNGRHTVMPVSVRETDPHDPRLNRWQDTIILPKFGSVTVRHRVSDFTGVYVIHCHILQHEDRGMMMNVLAVPGNEREPRAFFDRIMKRNDEINREIAHGKKP